MTGIFVQTNADGQQRTANPVGWMEDGSGCHIWVGYVGKEGYGRAWDGERVRLAHRLRYEREVGPIPVGLVLDHLCRNRACCNPAHLEPVTSAENASPLRGLTGIRNRSKTRCPKGHPLVDGNLIPSKLKDGRRDCLTCGRKQRREYEARRRSDARARGNAAA